MSKASYTKQDVLDAIRRIGGKLGHPPSLPEFTASSGIPKYYVAQHFEGFRAAVRAAGFTSKPSYTKQDVLGAIRSTAETLGHPPSLPELTATSRIPKYYVTRHFDGFRAALRAAGLEPYTAKHEVAYSKQEVLDAIRRIAAKLGHPPSLPKFAAESGIPKYYVSRYFEGFRQAVRAAGLEPYTANIKLGDDVILKDWGELVRKHRHIPTADQYRREGKYSLKPFEKHFGPWSAVPSKFRDFARNKPEWGDVVALLPLPAPKLRATGAEEIERPAESVSVRKMHKKLEDRPWYGNPIDFRGLRHEPVNEQGVVFLFGMVAKEMGYMVEAVQISYPDCLAKRQVAPGKWQPVRIEFEFESRNFDHPPQIGRAHV